MSQSYLDGYLNSIAQAFSGLQAPQAIQPPTLPTAAPARAGMNFKDFADLIKTSYQTQRNDPQGDANKGYMPGVNNEYNPFSNGFFKSADSRLADMTNHTGAYAPTNTGDVLTSRVAMSNAGIAAPTNHGTFMGADTMLPGMTEEQRRALEARYAPRFKDPNYSQGIPAPFHGLVRYVNPST